MAVQNILPDNSTDAVRLRKARDVLRITGRGIVMLAAWTVAKSVSMLFINRTENLARIKEAAGDADIPASDSRIFLMLLAIALIYLLIAASGRLFIGFSASAEGRGRYSGPAFIPVTAVMVVFSTLEFLREVIDLAAAAGEEAAASNTSLVTIIIDLTALIMMIEMLAAAITVRRLRKAEGQVVK